MKARVGVLLLILLLVGCTALARISTPSTGPAAFMAESSSSSARDVGPARLAEADRIVAAIERPPLSAERELEESFEEIAEYDPWEAFNEKTFWFNRQVDRFFLKPVATVWNAVLPNAAQRSLANALDNVGMPRRLVNNVLQVKGGGAGRELARFFINTTMGIGGFFDVATDLGIEKSDEDTGQTLGVYGVGPGPYLIFPFLPPLTVRDGIGFAIDGALDPLGYFIPFSASVGQQGGKIINDRSLNLELFASVEESVIDLYSAVRNAYLQRRQKAISE